MNISKFSSMGDVVVTGDLNSRMGNKSDFKENDHILLANDSVDDFDVPLKCVSTECSIKMCIH